MSRIVGDLTLGLGAQALAVLQLLAQDECSDLAEYDEEERDYAVEIRTRAWYNGRERGISLEVRAHVMDRRGLIITFGEHRTSDSIFIDSWEIDRPFLLNPPTVEDYPDSAYEARTFVPYGEVVKAVKIIREKIQTFIRLCKMPRVVVLAELGEESEPAPEPVKAVASGRARRALPPRRG